MAGSESGEWQGEGWWVELLRLREGEWAGCDLRWEWGEGGVMTVVPVRPGMEPLWEAIYPRLFPGEELVAAVEVSRPDGGLEWRLALEVRRGG